MWATIAGVAVILAQAAQPGPGSKGGHEWCFDRGQGTQLCEATEAACNHPAGDQPRNHSVPVQTCRAAGNQAIADQTACAPGPGAADANPTIAQGAGGGRNLQLLSTQRHRPGPAPKRAFRDRPVRPLRHPCPASEVSVPADGGNFGSSRSVRLRCGTGTE